MLKHRLSLLLLFLSVLTSSISTLAQDNVIEVEKDLESWSSASLNYSINSNWKVDLNQQLRLKDNSNTVDVYFTQLGVKYKFKYNISLGAGLRYMRENDTKGKIQGYENHLRWNTDINYKLPINRFSLKYRLRYQSKTELNVPTAEARTNFRFKTGLSYDIKRSKLTPVLALEMFHNADSEKDISKTRFTLGLSYVMKKAGEVVLFYGVENKRSDLSPKETQIIGLKYEFDLFD